MRRENDCCTNLLGKHTLLQFQTLYTTTIFPLNFFFFFLVKDNQIKYYTEYSNSLYKTIFAVVKSMTKLSISVPKCTIPEYLL